MHSLLNYLFTITLIYIPPYKYFIINVDLSLNIHFTLKQKNIVHLFT